MTVPPEKPWVLVRKGKPPVRFITLAEAKRFYDASRFNLGSAEADATVFGPNHQRWTCGRYRHSQWLCAQPATEPPP